MCLSCEIQIVCVSEQTLSLQIAGKKDNLSPFLEKSTLIGTHSYPGYSVKEEFV